jgi:hypothetical protein
MNVSINWMVHPENAPNKHGLSDLLPTTARTPGTACGAQDLCTHVQHFVCQPLPHFLNTGASSTSGGRILKPVDGQMHHQQRVCSRRDGACLVEVYQP